MRRRRAHEEGAAIGAIPEHPARPRPGTRVRAEFTEIANGRGAIARIGGGTVAAADAVPGDVGDVEVRDRREAAWVGRLVTLVRPSPHRVDPACPHFERCGGCQWQRVAAGVQAAYKGALVEQALAATGFRDVPVRVTGAPAAWAYRSAGNYVPAAGARGSALGLYAAAGPLRPVAIETCPIQSPALKTAFAEMQRAWSALAPRLGATAPGCSWRQVRIRVGEASREAAVGLRFAGRLTPRARDAIVDLIGSHTTNLVEITATAARGGGSMGELRWGRGGVSEALLDRWYHVPVFAPFPVTGRAAAGAVTAAVEALALDETTTLLETNAGIGAYTLPAAASARRVVGRTAAEHLAIARRNAASNGASNVLFVDRDRETLTRALRTYGPIRRALVQVTRDEAPFETLHGAGVERIVLTANSAAPLTAALAAAVAARFEVRWVAVLDTHPQTSRAEIHAVLDARRGAWHHPVRGTDGRPG